MKHSIYTLIFICIAGAASADIRLKIDQIAKGSSVTYLLDDGTRQTHHFEGKVGDTYEVTYWNGRGKGLDGGLDAIAIYNSDGRMVRGKRVTGQWMTYDPHNCFRVVGECRYTITRADGRIWHLGRRQKLTDDGFTFENFRVRGNVTATTDRGRVTLDDNGMMLELTLEPGSKSHYRSMAQERAEYR